eukprot:2627395-Pleurochrysis_carterae.AAC.1
MSARARAVPTAPIRTRLRRTRRRWPGRTSPTAACACATPTTSTRSLRTSSGYIATRCTTWPPLTSRPRSAAATASRWTAASSRCAPAATLARVGEARRHACAGKRGHEALSREADRLLERGGAPGQRGAGTHEEMYQHIVAGWLVLTSEKPIVTAAVGRARFGSMPGLVLVFYGSF